MAVKLILVACGLFVYLYAPHGLIPTMHHAPQALAALAGTLMVGPLVYHALRF